MCWLHKISPFVCIYPLLAFCNNLLLFVGNGVCFFYVHVELQPTQLQVICFEDFHALLLSHADSIASTVSCTDVSDSKLWSHGHANSLHTMLAQFHHALTLHIIPTVLYVSIVVDATHPPQRPWIPLSHPERNKPTGERSHYNLMKHIINLIVNDVSHVSSSVVTFYGHRPCRSLKHQKYCIIKLVTVLCYSSLG